LSRLAGLSTEDLLKRKQAAQRQLAIKEAQQGLLPFIKYVRPDPNDPDDATKSTYVETPQGKLLCEVIESAFRGERKRVAVSIGPQLGKSEVLTRCAPTWWLGKRPHANMIIGAYNQPFANTFGSDIQAILEGNPYQQVFPKIELRENAKDYITTTKGGKISLVGVGGSGTGKPADLFIVDDPIKGPDDANSETYRNGVWSWFSGVVFSRLHNNSVVIVVHTRWHEDDLIGRLCDPSHPDRNTKYKGIADDWLYINLPAVVSDQALADALGLKLEVPTDPRIVEQFTAKPMSALWPERKGLKLLAEARRVDKHDFESLYMGNPTPDDGDYFTADMIIEYESEDLPRELNYYGASDHAVSEKQTADSTVIGCTGIDTNGIVWVLPDLVWGKMMTDRMVEEILNKMQEYKPGVWWMESELISKSFGPFLTQRMEETSTFCTLNPVTPSRDKQVRGRAIQGRMQQRKVRFPRFAPWWRDARAQLLKFPYGAHDDFVDWLSWIGLGLRELHPADQSASESAAPAPSGSLQWLLQQTAKRAQLEKRRDTRYG
jgi:predicted phage terminase large subunit-like protein